MNHKKRNKARKAQAKKKRGRPIQLPFLWGLSIYAIDTLTELIKEASVQNEDGTFSVKPIDSPDAPN